ncbi:ferritin-like domain-containing protein [Chitinophagaceae bacterium MMS25-I14]
MNNTSGQSGAAAPASEQATTNHHDLLLKDVQQQRDPSLKDTDKSALYAIIQAAVNVELFTIPLYMTSLYSIQGTHQITGQNNFYQGRLWPGKGTKADPQTDNDKAFNAIFSVFIAEMLHLQLASNIGKKVGYSPTYTSSALQSPTYGWTCYGDNITVLPHILDFKDTIAPYNDIRVKLGAVNREQLALFLAIEETEDQAKTIIQPDKLKDYFPAVPFAGWQPSYTENNLPMFGSIGHMYLCLWEYLSLRYTDGTTLWDSVYGMMNMQQDLFNTTSGGHEPEYPKMRATISAMTPQQAQMQVLDMINGITDQGEGGGVVKMIKLRAGIQMLEAVQAQFQPDAEALKKDYPSYTDTGKSAPSRDAAARTQFGSMDHYETFQYVLGLVEKGGVLCWDEWHAQGNTWTADMLKTEGYDQNKYPIPPAEDVAGALNRLKNDPTGANYKLFSHASTGAIAGVTTVLNTYFNDPKGSFPFPSMSGSGDRMSICWAVFGKAPNLAGGIEPRQNGVLYHACQGMSLDPSQPSDPNLCGALEVYHTCRGSNSCKAEGGCGFVQSVNGGGGSCTSMVSYSYPGKEEYKTADGQKLQAGCGLPDFYSAPADNKCGSFGGCAVPISASQMFPAPAANSKMELFDFTGPDFKSEPFDAITYAEGDLVYDTAWTAYCKVLEHRGQTAPDKPKPSDLRLAFPPST